MNFFFYGTLRDIDLRTRVMGRRVGERYIIPARLPGYKCVKVIGRGYPGITPDEDHHAEGILISGVSRGEAAKLTHFEGPGYRPECLEVLTRKNTLEMAMVYLPNSIVPLSSEEWDIIEWRRRHKRLFIHRRQA